MFMSAKDEMGLVLYTTECCLFAVIGISPFVTLSYIYLGLLYNVDYISIIYLYLIIMSLSYNKSVSVF